MDHLSQRSVHLPGGAIAEHVQAVGYNDLQGRPGFKMSIRHTHNRWYLYLGHFWHSGWTVVDVTDPSASQVVAFIPGPENTSTFQMELAGDVMITALERPLPGFGKNPDATFDEGVLIWDISDPIRPKKLGQFRTGGTGTHRNFYAGGRYMHLAAGMGGFEGNIYVIVDISDPAHPVEAGRWWIPGQHIEAGEQAARPHISLHGPPYVIGTLAYLPYGPAGMVILDISEVSTPRLISQLEFCPFTSQFAAHSVLPVPDKGIAFVTSEDTSYGKGPLSHASIVDISDPSQPFLMAVLPVPHPPPGAAYRDFTEKGGWVGPHNCNHLQHNPDVQPQKDLFYLAHFNAGLRVYYVTNPRLPLEVGFFLPPDPRQRYGPMPQGRLVTQTEDVLVDHRGFIYITDKNQGLWILRYTGDSSLVTPSL